MPAEIIYPELSYQIVGAAFDVFNGIGFGMPEKVYQKAFAESLKKRNLTFEREKYVMITYEDKPLIKAFLDFVIDNKIIVEMKVKPQLGYVHIKQVMEYLKSTKLKLAILVYVTRDGIKYRRIVNLQ